MFLFYDTTVVDSYLMPNTLLFEVAFVIKLEWIQGWTNTFRFAINQKFIINLQLL